jgi:sucrose-phosphate synthase
MYLQLISVHGLVRGDRIEMGRDADTGGQVRYVVELARHLAELPEVEQVDLFTRRLVGVGLDGDPIDGAYGQTVEILAEKCRLVRISCGGDLYLRKEELWPHLDQFAAGLIAFTEHQQLQPTVVHGHYADAGYVARQVSRRFKVPFIFTGHSLGLPKLEYLLSEGWSRTRANQILNIDYRVEQEQACLDEAAAVIVSTRHEQQVQYADYRLRSEMPVHVLPPGTDLARFFPYYAYEIPGEQIDERFKQARLRMQRQLDRFFFEPRKPLILSLCRPDRRKNIQALIRAYGESPQLQALANLAVFAGIREDIESMPANEQEVLTEILLLLDRYDLYGKLAIPKRHDSDYEVPELYRLAASSRGIFVNSAFIELFGLTSIESSATGLPFVATEKGGPLDIVTNCGCGVTVDVTDQAALVAAMQQLLTDGEAWDRCSAAGINQIRRQYSWIKHCHDYLGVIADVAQLDGFEHRSGEPPEPEPPSAYRSQLLERFAERLKSVETLLICDIDGTLVGDDAGMHRLLEHIRDSQGRILLGVATGRSPALVEQILREIGVWPLELIIASVGSEILLGEHREVLTDWSDHLSEDWHPQVLAEALRQVPWLEPQHEPHTQRPFKLSYRLDGPMLGERVEPMLRQVLDATGTGYHLIVSHGNLVDVLPRQAGKGAAIEYLLQRLGFPVERTVVAGDSGNDRDMLLLPTPGVVVGNYAQELEDLRQLGTANLYIASGACAWGVLEGLEHFSRQRAVRC